MATAKNRKRPPNAGTFRKGHTRGQNGGGMRPGTVTLPTRQRALAIQRHAELSAEAVIEQIARGALYDIGDFYDASGNFKPLSELTEAQRQQISGIEHVMKNAEAGDGQIDRILKLKFAPREKYVEMAAKYHKLLTEMVEVKADDDLLARLDRGRLRNAGKDKG